MRSTWRHSVALATLVAATGLTGTAAVQAMDCTEIASHDFGITDLVVTETVAETAGENAPIDHCIVRGHIAERTGIDGNSYKIRFELRLPDDWNGRFVHQFNGGNDGAVVPAMGGLLNADPSDTALSRNYAVVSSDGGHDGEAHPEAGLASGSKFGFDPEARRDYGYGAVVKLNPVATKIIEDYYGKEIAYSYGVGGSNGGRHAMVQASRSPDAFDGILSGFPGFNLPRAGVQHAWDVQSFAAVNGDIRQAFTPDDLKLVSNAIVAACDGLDGLEDGIIGDTAACQTAFDISMLTCEDGTTDKCISAEQVEALRRIHAGPTNSAGDQLYSNWAWDRGLETGDWRFWKLESPIPPWDNMPLIATMGASSLAMIFSSPPHEVGGSPADLLAFLLDYDFDSDVTVDASDDTFTESPMAFMTPTDADNPLMAEFREAGGKMIVFHGVSDPVFSVVDTMNWYDRLNANYDGKARDFVTFYTVPGMGHGPGGPATDKFNAFDTLVDWVENGTDPEHIVAGVTPDNQYVPELIGSTRKLCPYPQVARYNGGDEKNHESFICQ